MSRYFIEQKRYLNRRILIGVGVTTAVGATGGYVYGLGFIQNALKEVDKMILPPVPKIGREARPEEATKKP